MATLQEHQRVKDIRYRFSEAATDWAIGLSGKDLLAVIVPRTPAVRVATLTDDCDYPDRDFLLHAYSDIRLLLRLYDEACEFIRQIRHQSALSNRSADQDQQRQKPSDYAAECSMKCADQRFLTFLRERHAVDISDGERVKTAIRLLLKVESRAELNSDPAAAHRWKAFKGDFDLWLRT